MKKIETDRSPEFFLDELTKKMLIYSDELSGESATDVDVGGVRLETFVVAEYLTGRGSGHGSHKERIPDSLLTNFSGHSLPAAAYAGVGGVRTRPSYGGSSVQPDIDDFVFWMVALDMLVYLPDDILVKVDRATMATSLESRAPFLDHRLVELSWRIPKSLKLSGTVGKWITRELLYEYVPREIVDRPKQGFSVPVDSWLRGPLKDWAEDLLDPSSLAESGVVDVTHVTGRWREHVSGRRNWAHFLWSVLMFESWRRAYPATI